ncbi:MAG: N-acetyltransferase [Sphaerospermopsis sp. SIO1G2]|nr:N-acetyltransferase [Sphaerospermopsis sp. SIO1G2]
MNTTSQRITIRPATADHAAAIQEIYAHYVLHTTASLEEVPPTVTDIITRMQQSLDHGLPYIVAMIEDMVAGYAYVTPYRSRSAYRYTVEESVYVAPSHRGQGIGKRLLSHLITCCQEKGYRQMLAVIVGGDNAASLTTHTQCGFTPCGTINNAGFKHGIWLDTMLMQRDLQTDS